MSEIETLRAALTNIAGLAAAVSNGDTYPPTIVKTHAQHRPLTARELEARAGEFDRAGTCHDVQITVEVASSTVPEPKTTVHRDGDRWRIELGVPGAALVRRTGLTVGSLSRPPRAQRTHSQREGFIPAGMAVRHRPFTERVAINQVPLRGRKGHYTPLEVFPGDSRALLTDRSWPWNLTGLVTTSDGKSGSGVLIGDRLMLTAHHMLPTNSILRGSWWMTFTPNFDSSNIFMAPFGSSNVSDLRRYADESDSAYVVGHDFMLCRLYEPLGQRLGYLGCTTFDDSWRGLQVWDNIGYPGDVGGGSRPAVQFNQSMEDDFEDDGGQYMETEASLNKGNSGGPFFAWFTDGQVRLCAVVSSSYSFGDDRDNALAGGDDMVRLIDWGRTNWPA
jgi:V8-like Glu-specific endopeptidase